MDDYHVTRVVRVTDDTGETRYLAKCAACGNVGVPQVYEGDAWAIADRHAQVQGFEKAN